MDFDHHLDWEIVKILTKVGVTCVQASRCGKFFINQKARLLIVINRSYGPNFPSVYRVFTANR